MESNRAQTSQKLNADFIGTLQKLLCTTLST